MEVLISESGGKYIEKLIEGIKIATMKDFFDEKGRLILNKPYLVQSMITENRYWTNRVKVDFPYGPGLVEFIESGFVYVWIDDKAETE